MPVPRAACSFGDTAVIRRPQECVIRSSPVGRGGRSFPDAVRERAPGRGVREHRGMPHHITLDEARRAIFTRESLQRNNWTDRDILRGVRDGALRRIQRNRYVLDAEWVDLWPESRHRIEVAAAFGEMRVGQAAAAYESAAVVWGLPLYRHVPKAVHVTVPQGKHVSSRAALLRHCETLPPSDVTVHEGLLCTTLDRTVFDLARALSFDAGVAVADAALRTEAFAAGAYRHDVAAGWRERMLARAGRARGARGVRQATEVIGFADGRAESPPESSARVQLWRLGFDRIRLQVPVRGPGGKEYRVDMEIEDVATFLEVDGASKYRDPQLRSGRSLEDVLLEEKRREDWIRGTTQHRLVRVEERHVADADALRRRLAEFGIRTPA